MRNRKLKLTARVCAEAQLNVADLTTVLNAVVLPGGDAPEWLRVPYGDVPYFDGKTWSMQRLNAAVAEKLVSLMQRAARLDKRLAAGQPFYVGHPDFYDSTDKHQINAWMQNQPPATGWIKEIRAGADALELRVEWTAEGESLVNSRTYKFFSPYFLCALVGKEKINGVEMEIYEPRLLKSAGLTNTPNWPMPPMVNAAITNGGVKEGSMNLLQRLIALIGDTGITTEDDAINAVSKIITAVRKLQQSIDARWEAEDAARRALPNAGDPLALIEGYIAKLETTAEAANASAAQVENLTAALNAARTSLATRCVHAAVARGAVLQEHAESRIADCVNAGDAFAARLCEIDALPKLMKTEPETDGIAQRANTVADRRAQIHELVSAAMPAFNNDYDRAFASVRKSRPDLFGEEPSK